MVASGLDDAKDALVADWWRHGERGPSRNVMIALRRADVADLNAAGQELMEHAGRRGPERIVVGDVELAVGDRIIYRRNLTLGVRNGTRATVLDVDEQEKRDHDPNRPRRHPQTPGQIPRRRHVQLGYATTGHSSQSLTVERAFVLGPGHGEPREWGYVALSGARRTTRIYVTEAELEVEEHAPSLGRSGGVNRLAHALATPSARPLANAIERDHPPDLEVSEKQVANRKTRMAGGRLPSQHPRVAHDDAGWDRSPHLG